jgi:serine/threonine protein kinase
MGLAAGTRIGAFEITGILGAGGLGEVYRARDTQLGRDVAIKVLPPAFVEETERLARFQCERRWFGWDLAPDGRFVALLPDVDALSTHVNVVVNWFDELKRIVPAQ